MNTFVRYFNILRLLKPYPKRTSTTDIQKALHGLGADERVLRTIQRDLAKLSKDFQIDGDEKSPRGWCWSKDATVLLPGMDLNTALTFRLMQAFMRPLIPNACLMAAEKHFTEAARVVNQDPQGHHQAWLEKVQIIQRGQPLLPPTINEEVLGVVYQALFNDRRFTAAYCKRDGTMMDPCTVNPLGLVFVNKTVYLVCTLWDYDDIKLMPLHRFESASPLDTEAREINGFSLERYVKEQKELDFPLSEGNIKLVASFSPGAAYHLRETPLSNDQEIKNKSADEVIVSATVADTSQLRWWLLGFGDQVEVLKPKKLRDEMIETAKGMAQRYCSAKS
ncbi:hypothetical protein OR1_02764 [Geobacter sp. OR-1]|uniref:helix-turn-helix transcriptional regulator n=1 Tax=Geobacter sp. OR-1 TaxID=1266765 RepID=UPI0005429D87|nr:WYL domain-containing protein [Geobacter sp. OR-1]GAM10475.1 hypothetical protein OR1_02764 [Geobacter sp. OR-1]